MRTKLLAMVSFILFSAFPGAAAAAPLKTFVSEFSVAGASNKDELKVTLQRILASRLGAGQVRLVESADQAELLLTGSYALFGKLFTLDVLLKNRESGAMTMVFEQGEKVDDLIPAVGRLAQKIDRELATATIETLSATMPATSAPSAPAPAAAKTAAPSLGAGNAAASATSAGSYLVKPDSDVSGNWTGDPLDGVFTGIALGRTLASGDREIFVASDHSIRFLRKGAELKQVCEIAIPIPAKVLAIDVADLDHDGTPEIYATIMDRENLGSRVYQPTETGLALVADNQPWFFRGIGDNLKNRTIFVQKLDASGGFYNGSAELVKTGNGFKARNSFKQPRMGNIFNSTRFRDKSGVEKVALLDEGGYLAVLSSDGRELWKSSDRYGGSESYYKYQSSAPVSAMSEEIQSHFLEQRIITLPNGMLLVPHNEGFTFGNGRSYSKYSIHALQWTGSLLKEAWHTQPMPSYLADYAYDADSQELYLLEVVQKEGLFTKGRTAISINKVE